MSVYPASQLHLYPIIVVTHVPFMQGFDSQAMSVERKEMLILVLISCFMNYFRWRCHTTGGSVLILWIGTCMSVKRKGGAHFNSDIMLHEFNTWSEDLKLTGATVMLFQYFLDHLQRITHLYSHLDLFLHLNMISLLWNEAIHSLFCYHTHFWMSYSFHKLVQTIPLRRYS